LGKRGKDGEPLYGRHSALQKMPQLGQADLVCFVPNSVAELGQIIDRLRDVGAGDLSSSSLTHEAALTSEEEPAWRLSRRDRDLLNDLIRAVFRMGQLARRGNDMIATGEAWNATENILEGDEVDVAVGLDAGFRRGDEEGEEGVFVCLRLNAEEIVLEEMQTVHTKETGSDHNTREYARLTPNERFDQDSIAEWLERLDQICNEGGAELMTSRDHV
jgi:hypothetical protein